MSWKDFGGGNAAAVRFFHVCTDGENNGIVHSDEQDYQQSIKIMAIKALQYGVVIISYDLMSTHAHINCYSENYEQAEKFAEGYKRDYSKYFYLRHKVNGVYRGINCRPIEINDVFYLKRCISYVLLNPVVAMIVKRPEDYRWSSFDCYYNKSPITGRNVNTLSDSERRRIFRTRIGFKDSGLIIDEKENLVPRSFVDYRFVENLFGGRTEFYKSLALTDSVSEEERYVGHTVRYNDNELFAEAMDLAGKRYGKSQLSELRREEKLKMVLPLKKRTGANVKRIGRILRLPLDQISVLTELCGE